MTALPPKSDVKLGLVIDLDTCVGCHACVVSCKGWNTENYGAPLSDQDAYGENPSGTFLNRVHSYEVSQNKVLHRQFTSLSHASTVKMRLV